MAKDSELQEYFINTIWAQGCFLKKKKMLFSKTYCWAQSDSVQNR